MDMIENLAKQASQITLYDIKSYYNQAKNMVLNVPEMEAKVREATNEDPWGASSTLMQEIATGTHNFQQFNEIMPTIYSRFMEKEAREWRQIYKALSLLEYLIKHGSERVVDDARAHVSTIKMLRNFHYIDEKGKDQGINVRNRAKEIAELLSDVDRIRAERRKAKANRSKYQGTGNELAMGGAGGMSFTTAGGSRYGGFGSESLGYGGGSSSRDYDADDYRRPAHRDGNQRQEYDEYEGADDYDTRTSSAPSHRGPPPVSSSSSRQQGGSSSIPPKPVAKEQPKLKEVNLFDFDDEEPTSVPAAAPAAPVDVLGDDDFDDFQQAPSAVPTSPVAASSATSADPNANLFALLNSTPAPAAAPKTTAIPSFSSYPSTTPATFAPAPTATSAAPAAEPAKKPAAASTFDDLWTTSLSSIGSGLAAPRAGTAGAGGMAGNKTIAQMEQEKAMSKLWSTPTSPQPAQKQQSKAASSGAGFDDLLF